jgi:hypothetical protein
MMIRACNIVAILLPLAWGASAAPAQAQGEARQLFDGKTLDGWEHVGPGKFVVEDGQLRTEGGMGLLWYSREKLGDCVIRVVYKTGTERSNSGVYVRIADKPSDPWFAVHYGFEVQIADGGQSSRGTGSIYTFAEAKAQPSKPQEWNAMEITLEGEKVSTVINGVPVAAFDASQLDRNAEAKSGEGDPARGPRHTQGYIGLQNHDKDSTVYFKEVSVRPLPARSK